MEFPPFSATTTGEKASQTDGFQSTRRINRYPLRSRDKDAPPGRVEPVTDFRFELVGMPCTAEYEYLYEETMAPPEKYVCVRMAFIAPNCGMTAEPFITEDGKPGVLFEFDEDQEADILLDSDAISWRT
jgi:hypothetical protein